MTSAPPQIRLQKFLAACGLGSRRRCEEWIAAGRVRVDGVVSRQPGLCIIPGKHRVEFDGQPIRPEPLHTYLADKPPGLLCTSRDPSGRQTLLDWARRHGAHPRLRLFTIGRLDGPSEGLILLTNDGALAHTLAHPRHHVEKEYRVWTDRTPSAAEIRRLRAGIRDQGEDLHARAITTESIRPPCLRFLLGEGRKRHIRRMLAAVGLRVRRLRRIRIGPLTERHLRGRPLRELTAAEIKQLQNAARPPAMIAPRRNVGYSAGMKTGLAAKKEVSP